ncbi:MAG: DUF4230 domain-containing protein [Chloroflexi bacterium]|nr:DUF4230 domain-containing protein [Chloroflexota bacterium]
MKANNFLLFGLIIVIIAVIGTLSLQAKGFFNPLWALLNIQSGAKTTIITSDAVIDKIEQVSELTTTKYTIQLVAKSEAVGEWYTFGATNVKMLLIAKGTVRAGLDLSKLDASAVIVSDDGKSVTVNLPPVKIFDRDQILSSNPTDTYVYDVQKGIVADSMSTETQLRGVANDQLLEAACKDGIMDEATKNAKIVVEQLLKTFVTNVTVINAPVPSVDACKAK